MRISFIPFYTSQLDNYLFKKDNNIRDNILEPYIKLKEYFELNYHEINTVDITHIKEADFIIFFDLNPKYIWQAYMENKLHKSIYIPFEPPVVYQVHKPENLKWIANLFGAVLTWQDDLVDNKKFFKFHFPMPSQFFVYEKIDFKDKKYITTIVGYKKSNRPNELYSKRIEAIKYFENKYDDFEFFGVGWDESEFKAYNGKVDSKYNILKNYKFTLCYENECNIAGLISEKIFDCFYARTIPVFWGASNPENYFPKDTYIDKRDFKTYDELDIYLSNMSENEYNRRIEAIETYLISEEFKKFSSESFAKNIFLRTVKQENEVENNFFELFLKLITIKLYYKIKMYFKKIKNMIGK
ncbi:glycosyltransferase family 10 domain-containing protein [Aliarcobacter butzleri]|uniref:glycosyltransferase family 10 domain-containing protein n=1 Tax=Aliarcobacter butzleri TaxID=28197 RepID=UPI002B24954D|nr:glycosyltransferase family 10 [Aliarcobacter butzleri]